MSIYKGYLTYINTINIKLLYIQLLLLYNNGTEVKTSQYKQ